MSSQSVPAAIFTDPAADPSASRTNDSPFTSRLTECKLMALSIKLRVQARIRLSSSSMACPEMKNFSILRKPSAGRDGTLWLSTIAAHGAALEPSAFRRTSRTPRPFSPISAIQQMLNQLRH